MNVHSQTAPRGQKREIILDAALELFAERGFYGTAVPEIARRAGIAAGTIYRYFDSKEQLVNELYQRCKRSLTARLLREFPLAAAPRDQFHALWTRLAAFAEADPLGFAFLELHHHGAYLDDASLTLERDTLLSIRAFADAAIAAGALKQMPPETLMSVVWGAFVGMVKAHRLGHVALTAELVTDTEACVWDAIRNQESQTS